MRWMRKEEINKFNGFTVLVFNSLYKNLRKNHDFNTIHIKVFLMNILLVLMMKSFMVRVHVTVNRGNKIFSKLRK